MGSVTNTALSRSDPGGNFCLHGRTNAQILKALATGPSVPAISGNAELANHHRLGSRWASSFWMGLPPEACVGLSWLGACDSWLSKASTWSSTWSPLSAIILARDVAVRAGRLFVMSGGGCPCPGLDGRPCHRGNKRRHHCSTHHTRGEESLPVETKRSRLDDNLRERKGIRRRGSRVERP